MAAREISHAAALSEKKQAAESKWIELANKRKIEAQSIYDLYKSDLADGTRIESWTRKNKELLQSTYKYFVDFKVPKGLDKPALIDAIRLKFVLKPPDLNLREEDLAAVDDVQSIDDMQP